MFACAWHLFVLGLLLYLLLSSAPLSVCLSAVNVDAEWDEQEIVANPASSSSSSSSSSFASSAHVSGAVLGYITPWNSGGYDTALQHIDAFSHLSPTWFTMRTEKKKKKGKGKEGITIVIQGHQNINNTFIQQVNTYNTDKQQHSSSSSSSSSSYSSSSSSSPPVSVSSSSSLSMSSTVRIVPRVLVEFSAAHQLKLAATEKMQNMFIDRIVSLITENHFDGVVIEMTDLHALVRQQKPELIAQTNQFIVRTGEAIHNITVKREPTHSQATSSAEASAASSSAFESVHSHSMSSTRSDQAHLIFVVRPYFPNSPYFQHTDLLDIHTQNAPIDYYSIMTYDYSHQKPGPNSPIRWVTAVIEHTIGSTHTVTPEDPHTQNLRARILLGMNLYGMQWVGDAPGQAILGRDYTVLTEQHKRHVTRHWDAEAAETKTVIADLDSVVYYPDVRSVQARVILANELGVGVAMWELGQGTEELMQQL